MARTQGTSPRAQRLIALFAVCAIAIATAFAFGRVFSGHGSTWRLMALASGLRAGRVRLGATEPVARDARVGGGARRGDRALALPRNDVARSSDARHAPARVRRLAPGRRAGPAPGRALAPAEATDARVDRRDVGGDLLVSRARLPRGQPAPGAPAADRDAGVRRHRPGGVHQAALRRRVPGGRARDRLRRRAPPGAGMGAGLDRTGLASPALRRRPAAARGESRWRRWAPP